MKVHYINILLFALPLNILVHNQRNHKSTTLHKPISRLLCECELYVPHNYDNDPQMKSVMDNFNKQTQQRFHEYDDRMKTTRQKCKERCDKEIQKIILKDKLEKQMEEQLTTLETKIDTDDIPTCICEKSLADKIEKGCLKCAQNLGGIVAPSSGVLAGIAEGALIVWKPTAITAAKAAALTEAKKAATNAGMNAVISKIKVFLADFTGARGYVDLLPIVNESTYKNGPALVESARKLINDSYKIARINGTTSFQNTALMSPGKYYVGDLGKIGSDAYDVAYASQTTTLTEAKVGAVEAKYGVWQTANIAPVIAIVVIVLIMVIIYLILRYRREKKMKKKLQYIKLLEE
ncbi:PIR protein, putative [Plasmodium sp. gorilla clade G1]|nr:PIR protein, putative [Plasmodium sp. gorilla clade G1]